MVGIAYTPCLQIETHREELASKVWIWHLNFAFETAEQCGLGPSGGTAKYKKADKNSQVEFTIN